MFLDINCTVIACANYLNYKNNRPYHIRNNRPMKQTS